MTKLIVLLLAASMLTATVGALEVQPEKEKTEYALSELPQNIKTLLPDSSQILSVHLYCFKRTGEQHLSGISV